MLSELIKLQSLEKKCMEIEKSLKTNSDKKEAQEAATTFKQAQAKTISLDEEAKKLVEELQKLQGVQEKGVALVEKYTSQEINGLDEEKLADLKAKIDKTSASLAELEKRLYAFNERVKKTLIASEDARKQAIAAKKSHAQAKENFTKSVDGVADDLAKYKEQIKELKGKIDERSLNRYNSMRAEGIFPVIVSLNDTRCSGCRMELPSLALEKIKKDGELVCPSCHRIIFIKKEK